MDELAEVIEIKDPEIDVAIIMEKIRQGIERHRPLYTEDVFFPSFRDSITSGVEQLGREFNYELQEAVACHDRAWVSLQVFPVRLPILGSFLTKVKRELHNLVVFYVNRLAAKQTSFNTHSVRALASLSEVVGRNASAMDLEQLRQEVQRLKEKVDRLEGELRRFREGVVAPEDADGQ